MKRIETVAIKQLALLVEKLREEDTTGIGELVGSTGTGKTQGGLWLAENCANTVRICAFEGIGRNHLLQQVARQFIGTPPHSAIKMLEALASHAAGQAERPLIVVDECNKLRWQQLEVLRNLADEHGFAVLLVGTELYSSQYTGRNKHLLEQLGRRIGGKRVAFGTMDKAEVKMYLLTPRFGTVEHRLVSLFWLHSKRGNWGHAVELANACERIMKSNTIATLSENVVLAAVKASG